jgi:hypothetical protein
MKAGDLWVRMDGKLTTKYYSKTDIKMPISLYNVYNIEQ